MARGTPPHRKRCKRWDVRWDVHYLTFSCAGRKPLLTDTPAAQWFLDSLAAARANRLFRLWAYVVMLEHAHVLLLPADGVRISTILGTIKYPVSRKALAWIRRHRPDLLPYVTRHHRNGKVSCHFWLPGGGYDRNMRSVRDIHEKRRYIHRNPVRRGLVTKPEDWPLSSYHAWLTGRDEPIAIDREGFPILVEF